jgi:hypothetical protein
MAAIRATQCCAVLAVWIWVAACGGGNAEPTDSFGSIGGAAAVQGGAAGAGPLEPGYCDYQGMKCEVGGSVRLPDGCNYCSCVENGVMSCTSFACVYGCRYQVSSMEDYYALEGESFVSADRTEVCHCQAGKLTCDNAVCAGACSYAGQSHCPGETFTALDGCNRCTCTDGQVDCTSEACACDPSHEYWRWYVSSAPEGCATIEPSCPDGSSEFSNACGCGCQISPDCPQDRNCIESYQIVPGPTAIATDRCVQPTATGDAQSQFVLRICLQPVSTIVCPSINPIVI